MQPSDYLPKRNPRAKQLEAFTKSAEVVNYALLMEQRTGKTKVILDTVAYQYERNLANSQEGITALLVVANPGRVHRNWVVKEIPQDLPDRIPRMCLVWDAGRIAYDKKKRRFVGPLATELEALLQFRGLAVLAVNGGAVITESFRRYALKFLLARKRVLAAADEFTLLLKTPNAKTTKVLWHMGEHKAVVMRRILDGTPVGNGGPLDLYGPFRFLDWRILGHQTNASYKAHFAKWETAVVHRAGKEETYPALMREPDGTPMYQNLDDLATRMAPVSFRVLRSECWDAPAKVYQVYPFQLSPEQRKVYDSLRDEYEAELHDGYHASATHALTRMMRLQQVASNYWPPEKIGLVHVACKGEGCLECDDLGVIPSKTPLRRIDPKRNPRVDAAREIFALNPGPGIVWCRFHEDVDNVLQLASQMDRLAYRYDGRSTDQEKDLAEDSFQTTVAGLLVGNPASGGRGLRLDNAGWILNYSNQFSLLTRLQGEDRAEAEGKLAGTGIIDLVAEDTVDETIVDSLRANKSIADFVLRERGGKWL